METRTRLVLVKGGLPEPSVQCLVRNSADDAARHNRLRLLGWTVLRFTADDVLRNPARVVNQVRAAISKVIN
jgi:very-short-patch-repair endonuclease